MALKENPALVLKKFEELKKWQKQQEEKLRIEQESQRDLLMAAQRRMYEAYHRDLRSSSQSSYNDESLHQTSLESFPRIGSPENVSPPIEQKTQAVKNYTIRPGVSFDDVPVPSPHKDFNELLGEKLRQSEDKPKESVPSKTVKRPFLRKGQGLVKYRLNPDSTKTSVSKPSSVAKPNNEKNKILTNKPNQFIVDQPVDKIQDFNGGLSFHTGGLSTKATWANVLSKNENEPACPELLNSRPLSRDQRAWNPSGSESSPNKPVGTNKMTKKELEDLRLFELLEQKAANSSFCSTSSTIARLLEKSHQSTPNKTSARERQLSLQDFRVSPLRPPSNIDRSLHVRFADQENYDFFQKPVDDSDFDQSSCDISEDCGEPLAVKNAPLYIGRDADGQKIDTGLSTIEESPSNFQDSETWSDGCASLASESSEDVDDSVAEKTIEEEIVAKEDPKLDDTNDKMTTSPTAQLVRTAVEGVAYKSDLLRKRLQELEGEIETFRKENASLTRMKRLHELDMAKFAKEKKETERAFQEKQEELTNLLDAERKKLQKDKKVFEKYYKELKSHPSKMEREEITALKLQVENLREELVKKDSRWSATQVRTRDRLKHLEAENVALKSQLADLKRERQEWQKRRASLPNQPPSRVLERVAVCKPTKVIHAINTHIGRIKPADLKDAVTSKRKPPPIKERVSLLTNRPIWGARNPVKPVAPSIRRTKSVPDVRPQSPQCKKAVRIQTYNAESSETETESECEIDERSSERVEKLRQTVYDTYYGNLLGMPRESPPPREKLTKAVVVDLTKKKDDSDVVCDDLDLDDVPEYMTAIRKKIAYHQAKLDTDEKKPKGLQEPTESIRDSLSPQSKDSVVKAAEVNPPIREKSAERDHVTGLDDKMPTEIVRANGFREKTFPDGRKEIWYPNGNVKKVAADKSVVKIVYFNGDVKETLAKCGLVKYYYAESKTWHSTYNDGTEILEFANGQRERRTTDGTSEITYPNGCVRVIYADGKDEWTSPDGTRVSTDAHGEKVARLANGQREIHTATHKRREYPDGTVKLVYPDGLQETRYANGRIRIKDKDGNLVMDSADQAS